MITEHVVLVDATDRVVGTAEKLHVHRAGVLHRAFSVVLLNAAGEMLLQRRALSKYHSGGLWSNTCCGHPRPGESTRVAAERRLREEMGISCTLSPRGTFVYRMRMSDGLVEHEYDHVLVGITGADPLPDAHEAMAWRWADPAAVAAAIARTPHRYTPWLPMVLERLRG